MLHHIWLLDNIHTPVAVVLMWLKVLSFSIRTVYQFRKIRTGISRHSLSVYKAI